MFPRLSKIRATLIARVLTIELCGALMAPQISARPTQAQMEMNEAGRKIKTRVAPQYPELARKIRIQGIVRVQFTVTPEGTVKEVKELGGNPVLLEALVKAVKQWKYEPAGHESVVEVKAEFVPAS
jgi:TonB family protein